MQNVFIRLEILFSLLGAVRIEGMKVACAPAFLEETLCVVCKQGVWEIHVLQLFFLPWKLLSGVLYCVDSLFVSIVFLYTNMTWLGHNTACIGLSGSSGHIFTLEPL